MFNVESGEKLAREVYKHLIDNNDVSEWSLVDWGNEATEYIEWAGYMSIEYTDLMAWTFYERFDCAWDVWTRGFKYVFGGVLMMKHDYGWEG